MIKCICFDMDNTLYPESEYYKACYRAIAKIISPLNEDTIYERLIDIRNKEGDRWVFQRIIDIYNLDKSLLDQFINIYRNINISLSLYPDVEEYLNNYKLPIKYGILTNGGKKTQQNKIRCLGLVDKFDFIIITGQFLPKNKWKPHKDAFDLIMKESDLSCEEYLYVGDSFENDIIGSLNVGMNAIFVDRNSSFRMDKFNGKNYWIINNFNQINKVVEMIEG